MADVNQLYQKANNFFKKGRIKDANNIYKKIIKQKPTFVSAINMYGITLAQLGELSTAVNQFKKVIKLEPEKPAAYENVARVYMQLQDYAQSKAMFERALALGHTTYSSYFGLAGVYMSQNDFSAAVDFFNKAKVIKSSDPLLYINMGSALSQLERFEQSIDAFNHAITLDPISAEAYLRLGQLYIHINNFIEAEKILYKASQINSDDFNIQISLADAYQHNSNTELALKHYFIAEELIPGSQNIYTKLDKLILYEGTDEKKGILRQLAEPHIFKDYREAHAVAVKLAELTEYSDDKAIGCLNNFFSDYDPEILYSRDWWQQKLAQFGPAVLGHDKILRGIHSAVFSWSLPDKETLTSISDFVSGTRLYSYGAGSAFWEHQLSEHFNVEIKATDFKPRHSFLPITEEDYSTAVIPEGDSVFIAWIVRGDTGILNVLNQFKTGQKLVLVGEPPDKEGVPRICATPEIFSLLEQEFTLFETIPLISYSALNDTVNLFIKN
jgi:tetratricopeptide (TPR) repeat protein